MDGFLERGDILVCDNAPVHKGVDSLPKLSRFLAAKGIQLWFLPKYSPELNPCELVFAQVKNWLRRHRNHNEKFYVDLARAFSNVSLDNMQNYYRRCIEYPIKYPFVIPPGISWG
jgi:transposase